MELAEGQDQKFCWGLGDLAMVTDNQVVQASGEAGNVNVGVISTSGYPKPPEGQDSQGSLTPKWRQLS